MQQQPKQIMMFSQMFNHAHALETHDDTINSLIVWKGIKRTSFYMPIGSSKSPLHIDSLVIDERSRYTLRHVAFTVWNQNQPIGYYDIASPHLYKDIKPRCFGIGNETMPAHTPRMVGDYVGIPAHALRHQKPGYEMDGYYFDDKEIESEALPILVNLGETVIDTLTKLGRNKYRFTNHSQLKRY